MEAMWARFLPHIREIRRLLAEGVLGDLVTVHADHAQWFEEDPEFRLFAPKLGGGAQLDLGIYPVSFASMVLGTPNRVVVLSDPAFTGVDAQTSILLGYESGAHAVLNSTLRAAGTTRAAIVGTEGRIEIDGAFYQPTSFTLIPRGGEPQRMFDPPAEGGLRHEADEVARCIEAGELESPEMPLDETVAIMRTMDEVLAQVAATASRPASSSGPCPSRCGAARRGSGPRAGACAARARRRRGRSASSRPACRPRRTTQAMIFSPRSGSSSPVTAASLTPGWSSSATSISPAPTL